MSSESRSYREVTLAAIVFAIVIGVVMNAAITYAGLKIGFTIVGSSVAAVLGFGVLRGLGRLVNPRAGSIVETNIAQTIASSVNTTNSGIIFTVPVLLLLGYSLGVGELRFWLITLACMAGAVLGCAFIIPLRKQMIDIDRLRFPSATAVGAILKSPGAGPKKALVLVSGIVVAMAIYLPTQLPQFGWPGYGAIGWTLPREVDEAKTAAAREVDPEAPEVLTTRVDRDGDGQPDLVIGDEQIDVGRAIGLPDSMLLVFAIAPFALGAGYLTGKVGLTVTAGGVLAYLILNPILFNAGYMPESVQAHEAPGYSQQAINRPLGIGLLLGGAMMGVIVALPAVRAAIKSVAAAGRTRGGSDELGLMPLVLSVLGAFVVLFFASELTQERPSNRVCPVTKQTLILGVGEVAANVAPPVEGKRPTVTFAGSRLTVVDEAAVEKWNSWTEEEREAAAREINARPGLLAGLPTIAQSLIIALVGTAWIWFAGIIIAQCTGMTDWSPISGIALLTVVLVLILGGTGNVIPAVLIGATLCCAITIASDMMADLRTGYIVGAIPRRQQVTELMTAWIGPTICMMTILLIAAVNSKQFGVPMGEGTPTTAPQAQALRAVINGVQGGDMPYALYGFGAVLGLLLGLGAFAGLGVLVGLSMYLPFVYISTYGIGCLVNITISKIKGRAWAEEWGVPFAAGLIVGEAILALVINAIVLIRG